MTTLQQVLDLAIIPLNDDDEGRNTASDKLAYLNNGLLQAFRTRSDLFVGSFLTPPSRTSAAGATFPLPDEYVQVFADYVVFRCETLDDEGANDGRGAMFAQLFGKVIP